MDSRIVLSHSRVMQYLSCPNRYRFSNLYGQRYRPGEFTAFAPDVGTALHRAMQHYMLHKDYKAAVWELGMAFPWPLYDDPYIGGDKGRSMSAALAGFDCWIDTNPTLNYELTSVSGNPASELTIHIDLGTLNGRNYVYELHMDMLCVDNSSGMVLPVDIKTYAVTTYSSDKTGPYHPLRKYEHSTQLIGYALGARMLQERAWTGETLEALYWFLRVDLREPEFEVKHAEFDATRVSLWLANIRNVCYMIDMQAQRDDWLRGEASCHSYGRACEHSSFCWTRSNEAEIDSWLRSSLGREAAAAPEPFDFSFRMEIL